MKQIAAPVFIFLLGCGGGSVDSHVSAIATCAVKIQLFGDSTMVQNTGLQGLMDAQFGPGHVTVENRGASGTTSNELLAGTDGVNLPWPQSVNANIVVINHGINDANFGLHDNQQITPLLTYKANLRAFESSSNGAQVIFQTPNPITWSPPDDAYAQAMIEVSAEKNLAVADVFHFVMGLPNWQATLADGIHPSSALEQQIDGAVLVPTLTASVIKICS